MCLKLSISRAAYYKWCNHIVSTREAENEAIEDLIMKLNNIHKGVLGYRRMTMYVNKITERIYNQKRIRRLMRVLDIKSVIRKSKYHYIHSIPEKTTTNLLHRDFTAVAPNMKWCTDVTEFKIFGSDKKLYLSAIIDLYDRRIVSYSIGNSNNNNLVFRNFKDAIKINPNMHGLFHSDRGYQYTSRTFYTMLKNQGILQSMSRVHRCIDNGVIEGFWGIVKSEMYYLNRKEYDSELKLTTAIDDFIDYYNNDRLQQKLGCITPSEKYKEGIKKLKKFNNFIPVITSPVQNIIYL